MSVYKVTYKTQANKTYRDLHMYSCCVSHCLQHSPASRLSRAVLLIKSMALDVEDLMWSLKDRCSSSSLMERDIPISIHQNVATSNFYLVPSPVPVLAQIYYCTLVSCQSCTFPLLLLFLPWMIGMFKDFIFIWPVSASIWLCYILCTGLVPASLSFSLCSAPVWAVHSHLLQQASVR